MSEDTDIDHLLAPPVSLETGERLVSWADSVRTQIARGDMMLGILSVDDVEKVPVAYQAAADSGVEQAWLRLAWWHALPDLGEQDLVASEMALSGALKVGAIGAELELVKIRWFFKRDSATLAEKKGAYQLASDLVSRSPNDGQATYFLALLTTHGFGVEPSPEAGFDLQRQAADLGSRDAMFELYIHYAQGIGTAVNEGQAYAACLRAAEAGHARAMYNLGAFHATGRGTAKDMTQAVAWYERAADAGNPSAMAGLAVIYATGDGVEVDREYAEQLFDQADYLGLDVSELRAQVM